MKIQIIIGSTRPGRVGPQVANWIFSNLTDNLKAEYEIVDIAEYNLPVFNEANHPSMNQYEHDYTKVWSEKIKQAEGYIFLTPEYNAGYPASIKNAIDYLYSEWSQKPVMIVSYGVGGGTTASSQLRQVTERLKMLPTNTSPAISITREMSDENGQIKNINETFLPYVENLKTANEELLNFEKTPQVSAA
jgi:NAD(P)H-dependent FMN reductase